MRRAVDVIDGPIKGGVGIPMAAGGLHRVGEFVRVHVARTLENHVLEEMGKPGSEVPVLVNAAGFHPDLGADHGRGGIGIENQGEAVGQGLDGGGGGRVFHEISSLDREVDEV